MPRKLDLTGQRFGFLVVVSFDHIRRKAGGSPVRMWKCVCDCGNETFAGSSDLRTANTKSCGCRIGMFVHGATGTPEYYAWKGMKDRCYNPNNIHYQRYGGRGITVCDRWRNDFDAFLDDVGMRPSPNHSIERINNDGNYEPGNCKWATDQEQRLNTSRTRRITMNGKTQCVKEWCDEYGFHNDRIYRKVRVNGMSYEDALVAAIKEKQADQIQIR